ncbi:MAG: chorismate synthase [Bacillota bacterium]|nr:chorismate synthase [Bacillota bacterium]
MKSTFGKNIIVSIWGGSHEDAIGVDITGLPVGTKINKQELGSFLKRRAPGTSPFATQRKEADVPIPVSGIIEGDTWIVSDQTVSFQIINSNRKSGDYKNLRSVPRPGHADYTARMRYGTELNMAGGGPFSARMTAPLCIAGGIALQILERQGITIGAHILSIGNIKDTPINPVNISSELADTLKSRHPLAVIDPAAGKKMEEAITAASKNLDSLGGVIEGFITGLPAGIGGAMYDGLESTLAPVLFGIPAVKGVEFGAGFESATLLGSQNNDPFYYDGDTVRTATNNHGGILGGITSGMPLITRLAFKPTPSIGREQDSVNLDTGKNEKLTITGRHDPCVAVRAVPIVEAALAIGILDCMMEDR